MSSADYWGVNSADGFGSVGTGNYRAIKLVFVACPRSGGGGERYPTSKGIWNEGDFAIFRRPGGGGAQGASPKRSEKI